jgi:hypothetical protein
MSSQLAPSVFLGGIEDELAAVDVYTQTTAKAPIDNASFDPFQGQYGNDLFGCTATPANNILNNLVDPQGVLMDSTQIVNGVISENSELQSAFYSVESGLQKLLTNAKGLVNVSMKNGQISTKFNLSSAANLNGIKTMLNVVGGGKGGLSLTNISGQVSFISNLLKVSAKFKIPGAYTTAIGGITDARIGLSVTKNILGDVVANSSVSMLADIASGPFAAHVKAMMPNIASKFSANFKFSTGTKKSEHASLAASIASSFFKINASWSNAKRGGKGRGKTGSSFKDIFNANVFLNSSGDFKIAMKARGKNYNIGLNMNSNKQTVSGGRIPNPSGSRAVSYSSPLPNGKMATVHQYPNGIIKKYYDEEGLLIEDTQTPQALPTNPQQFGNFNNSRIDDPVALGSILSEAYSPSNFGSNLSLGGSASESLSDSFPSVMSEGAYDVYDA